MNLVGLLFSPTVSVILGTFNTYAQVSAIVRLSRATCLVTFYVVEGTSKLLSLIEFKSYLNFNLLADPLTDEGGEETGVPGETP